MNNRFNHSHNPHNIQSLESDKYLQVFKNLESVNLRNKAAFDELLKYTYTNLKDTKKNTDNENL